MDNFINIDTMSVTVTERQSLWNAILANIKKTLGSAQVYDAFFNGSYIASIEGNTMTIAASSPLAAQAFSTSFFDTISTAVAGCTGTNYTLVFTTKQELLSNGSTPKVAETSTFFKNAHLDPRFTFDSFVVGDSDIEASQAAILIAANPGASFNPLMIHGDSGLGKTHLLEAIGNSIKKERPTLKVLYISASDFIDEFVNYATNYQSDQSFNAYFKNEVDVLLLDDVQYLRKKAKTMEMFFNVFQTLANAKKQIVLTSDQEPSTIDGMDERLRTRFSQGLSVKIKKPSVETSQAILRSKIAASDLSSCQIDDAVIELFAKQFSDNVRELEGALNRLLFYTINIKPTKHITKEIAAESIASLIGEKHSASTLSPEKIVSTVADFYNLSSAQILGKMRLAQIALARHISMYLCRDLLAMNYSEVAKVFSKDHTSVMNAISKVEYLLKTDVEMQKAINSLEAKLKP